MPPKNRIESQPLDQGLLFPIEISREHPPVIGNVLEGGVFPEDMPPAEENAERRHFHEVVSEQVAKEQATRNRREGQSGKHSADGPDGYEAGLRLGAFLPGFGPVKERNWEEAKTHAKALDAKRLREETTQPILGGTVVPAEVRRAVVRTADKLSIEKGLDDKTARRLIPAPIEPLVLNPDQRRAFGSVPNLLRDRTADAERITSLTPEDYKHVDPDFLRKSVSKEDSWSYHGVALNREEYKTVLLNADTFEARARVKALSGKELGNPTRYGEVSISGPMHAFERLIIEHDGLIASLDSQHQRLMRLAQEAQSPGFAHMDEAKLLEMAHEAWQLSFKNLLSVAARVNKFTPEQAEAAQWALYDTLINGSQRQKIGAWQDMLAVGIDYANRRRLTMVSSRSRVDSRCRKLRKELKAYCDENEITRLDLVE